jgi:flagellar hook-associated protein FlgK
MSSAASIALSGMNAAQAALGTSAHNIANLGTEGFKRQQVSLSTQPDGGVSSDFTQAAQAGNQIETDVVNQLQAKNAFLANLAVFKAQSQMAGALLDATG